MVKFVDKDNKVKFILKDEDSEPISIDDLIIKDQNKQQEEREKLDGTCKR